MVDWIIWVRKSTIAKNVEQELFNSGKQVYILDGDNIRKGLSKDLGFTTDDRTENIRRIAEVATSIWHVLDSLLLHHSFHPSSKTGNLQERFQMTCFIAFTYRPLLKRVKKETQKAYIKKHWPEKLKTLLA